LPHPRPIHDSFRDGLAGADPRRARRGGDPGGQVNIIAALLLVGFVVAGVWVWRRLPLDLQDSIRELVPIAALAAVAVGIAVWLPMRAIRRRRARQRRREQLIAQFERETTPDRQRDLAFELIEFNRYELAGLERVTLALGDVLLRTMKTAVGDKQHRIRGMAASHLGVLRDKRAVPALLAALEDDHAYVRACAALGLGRMRAVEAKHKLAQVMKDDWDQTVRSRAREAFERLS
jgi:hypothetical protein